jgi:hypothetical protein
MYIYSPENVVDYSINRNHSYKKKSNFFYYCLKDDLLINMNVQSNLSIVTIEGSSEKRSHKTGSP